MQRTESGAPGGFGFGSGLRRNQDRVRKTGGVAGAGERRQRFEVSAALIEALAQNEAASNPHADLETEPLPAPRFTVADPAGQKLIDKEEGAPPCDVDRGCLMIA